MAEDGVPMKAFVGVSGFSYPAWKGEFYPAGLKSEDFLPYYSRQLGSVEINSSFYAAPGPAMIKGWAAKTGESFRFSFKAPRQITHIMKLGQGSQDAANRMSGTLDALGRRRGPILFQLPPFLKFDRDLLDGFLSKTSGIEPKVFEFRNTSWFTESTYDLLEDHGAGFCIAETEELEPTYMVTGGLAYFRLRKDSYDATSMAKWSAKIKQTASGSDECYVYLRHDATGKNAVLAQGLAKTLGA
jgi:uncharacterized protein YecE (DUF72 family)